MSIKCVHTEHCCRVHGCKYGDEHCPVYLCYKSQSYPCEHCDLDMNDGLYWTGDSYRSVSLADVPKISAKIIKERRAEYEGNYDSD